MYNIRTYIAIGLLILLLGCGDEDPKFPLTDKDFQTGTDSIEFDFFPGSPPDTVFDNAEFTVSGDAWNKGAYDITEGYATLIVEGDYLCVMDNGECVDVASQNAGNTDSLNNLRKERATLIQEKNQYLENPQESYLPKLEELNRKISDLDTRIKEAQNELGAMKTGLFRDISGMLGRSLNYPEGTSKDIEFSLRAEKMDVLSVQHTTPVILTTCYTYSTELAQEVCIKPDPASQMDSTCDVVDQMFTDQGAPIAVTKLETKILPDGDYVKPQFIIYVEDKDKGRVIARNMVKAACSAQDIDRKDWDEVWLSDFRFSNNEYYYKSDGTGNIICTPNPLRLDDGEDYIRCTINNDRLDDSLKIEKSDPSYTTQIFMKFDYGYSKTFTKNIVVEKTR